MDVLSNVLRIVRLTGSVFFKANLFDPFSIAYPDSTDLLQNIPFNVECVSLFHIITEGSCWFKPEGRKAFVLEKGTILVFPNGYAHTMCSRLKVPSRPLFDLLSLERIKDLPTVKYGGNGQMTEFVCGYLFCDQRFNPLIGALPDLLVLIPEEKSLPQINDDKLLSIQKGSRLDVLGKQLVHEVKNKGIGSATVVTRLTELLYMEILRRFIRNMEGNIRGWLAGIRDPEVGKALMLIHESPDKKWKVEDLSKEVGVSRSAFAQRFTKLIGESPMRYLTNWRMQLAKNYLMKTDQSIAMVAGKVGYESSIAFNRAFSRNVGTPPATWRDQAIQKASKSLN